MKRIGFKSISKNLDAFIGRLRSLADEVVTDQMEKKRLLEAWTIPSPTGGYMVEVADDVLLDKKITISRYYENPPESILSESADKNYDTAAKDLVGYADDLYEYGERPSKERFIKGDLFPAILSIGIKDDSQFYKNLQDVVDKIGYENMSDELKKACDEYLGTDVLQKYVVPNSSFVTRDTGALGDFFKHIDFPCDEILHNIIESTRQEFEFTSVYGNQLSALLRDNGYNIDNPFVFNDLDNKAYYCGSKDGCETYAVTCQNTAIFVAQKKGLLVAVPFAKPIDFNFYKIETVKDLISEGQMSSEYAGTTENSPHYMPTLQFLLESDLETIKGLGSVAVCIDNGELIKTSIYAEILAMNIKASQTELCDELNVDCERAFPSDGTFLQTALTLAKNSYFNMPTIREHLFWTTGTGFEWTEDGYMMDKDLEMILDPNITSVPDGDVNRPSYFSRRSIPILNIPENVRPDWYEQIKLSFEFMKNSVAAKPENKDEIEVIAKVEKYLEKFESNKNKKSLNSIQGK